MPQQRKQSTRADRAARLAAVRAEQRKADRRRGALLWGSVALVLAVIIGGTTYAIVRAESEKPDLSAVKTYQVEQGHVETPVDYAQTPPAGGEHAPEWLNCGVYQEAVPNENAVHAMEHGAVWVTYRPDLAPADVDALRSKLRGRPYTVLSPYAELPAPVVASAWGTQLAMDGAGDSRLDAFLKSYVQGPQAPEPGAVCTGGIGTPSA